MTSMMRMSFCWFALMIYDIYSRDAKNLAPIKFDSSLVIIWGKYDEVLYWSLSHELFEMFTIVENLIYDIIIYR